MRAQPLFCVLTALLAAMLLASCGPFGEPRLPEAAVRATAAARATLIAAAPTRTPPPGSTAVAARLPTPNLPMATAYATPRPQPEAFEVAELGLRVTHPFHWNRSSGAVPGTLVQLANRANDTFVLILSRPRDGKELQGAADETHELIAEWLGGMERTADRAVTLGSGLAAWRSEYRADYPEYQLTVQALVVSVVQGKQLITLAAYGREEHVAAERETVEAIFNSVELREPTVFGLPRSETYVFAEPPAAEAWAYDPARGQGDRRVFGGLVSLDVEQRLQPELAESWAISPDSSVYTFTLREQAQFHDGKPVTAADVIYSWERALEPATASTTALTYLGDIAGAAERAAGTAERVSGLRALDERTIEVRLVGPRPYFLLKLTAPAAAVVDQANVAQGPEWFLRPNGTGPYRLISWMPGQARLYERNERFYGEPAPIRYLAARLDIGFSGAYRYRDGELDALSLDSWAIRALDDPSSPLRADVRQAQPLCTAYVAFDTSRPPFDDPKVRQAFALAVDRARYEERAAGASLPARGLYPWGLPGAGEPVGLPFDPEAARARLAESSYGGGPLPPITLTTSGYGFWVEPGVGVLVQMWQERLGASIQIEQLEPTAFQRAIQGRERGNLFFWEWCADYPDPENFADALFHSGAAQNIGGYRNPDLDGLLERARVEPDVAARLELYRQAERLIVDDGAAIFLTHRVDTLLVAPRVVGAVRVPGHVAAERYLRLETSP